MFGKVKKWLGIEGVKLELILPETVDKNSGRLQGSVRFTSMNDQTVTFIQIILIEKFVRGRGEEKLIDEYELGRIEMTDEFDVPANTPIELDFELHFDFMKSEMDELGEKNVLFGGLVKTAKWLRGVESTFNVVAEAKVQGVALAPFDKKIILFS
jgi:hypothetical protein